MRAEIVLCWESKIIINFSNRQVPGSDPGTLLHLDGVLHDSEEALKALKEALEDPSRISAILHTIMNNSKFADLPLITCSKSVIKTLKLDTRTVSARVDLISFY